MSVVHPQPHPRQFEVFVPANPEIARKYGQVRVEDWDDRVAGEAWIERLSHRGSEAFPEAMGYMRTRDEVHAATGFSPASANHTEIVRCHATATGELVLLHDDWL
jgi:hypothetical protein